MLELFTVPASEPLITDETGREIRTSKLGPLKRNQTAVLHCHVAGGKPTPQVEWYLNGQRFPSSAEPESNNHFIHMTSSRGNGILDDHGSVAFLQHGAIIREIVIGPLKRSHQDAQVTCRTFNSPISAPKTRTVTLDIQCKSHFFYVSPNLPKSQFKVEYILIFRSTNSVQSGK